MTFIVCNINVFGLNAVILYLYFKRIKNIIDILSLIKKKNANTKYSFISYISLYFGK